MQNTTQLVRSRGKKNLQTRPSYESRRKGEDHTAESAGSIITTKELSRSEAETFGVQRRGQCLLTSLTDSRSTAVWSQRKVSSAIRWTLPNHGMLWTSGLSSSASTPSYRHPQHLSCVLAQEVLKSPYRDHPCCGHPT